MGDAELAHLGELPERANVENRDVGAVRAQDDGDSPLLDVLRDDRQAPIASEQAAQPSREQIVEAADDDADGVSRRRGPAGGGRVHTPSSAAQSRWVSRASPASPPSPARRSPVVEEE